MKLYLDDDADKRPTPTGWVRAYTAPEAIELLKTCKVTHLCLDHDLGPPEAGTGYEVCKWIEKRVFEQAFNFDDPFTPPVMTIHTDNPVGRKNMEWAIMMIYHYFKVTQPVAYDNWRNQSL